MIDLGFQIPQIGQYIMYVLGAVLILAGIMFAIISLIRGKKTEIKNENIDEKARRRRKRSERY